MKKFIYGILFVSLILPLIDNFVSIITQATKYLCMDLEVKCFKMQSEATPQETHLIGFQAPSSDDYDEEEDC
jgi:hypothetical protein